MRISNICSLLLFWAEKTTKSQTKTKLTYIDSSPSVLYISYVFEDGVLDGSGIVLPYLSSSDALAFLAERYVLTGSNSVNTFYFESLDKTIRVGLQISYPECVIGYFKNTAAKSISDEDLMDRVRNITKE